MNAKPSDADRHARAAVPQSVPLAGPPMDVPIGSAPRPPVTLPNGPLALALRDAAADLESHQPPPAVRAAVQRAWHARHAPANVVAVRAVPAVPAAFIRWFRTSERRGGAVAVLAVLLVSVVLWLAPLSLLAPSAPGARPGPAGRSTIGLQLAAARGSDFLPVLPGDRWPAEPGSAAWLVQTEVPGERLAALGLPFDPARAGESVRAELLVHPNGDVLAVRFLR